MSILRYGIILALSFALAAHAQSPGGVFGSPGRFTETGGADIYRAVCAECHMPNGQGAQGAGAYPALANDPHLASAGYAIGLVLHGHADMPAFSRTLTNRQIADVLTYLRQNFGNDERDPITEADVQAAR